MANPLPIYRSLALVGVLCLADGCDHASALLQAASPSKDGAPISLGVDKCITITYPHEELVMGAVVDPDDLLELDWGDTNVNACCARPGTGTMQVTLMTNDGTRFSGYPVTCTLPPLPLPEAPQVGILVNLSAPFRAHGRTVDGFSISPSDLASQATINALLAILDEDVSTAEVPTISADAGDIGLLCDREGEGSVEVFFDDSGPSPIQYALTCHAHDQGGGG